MTSAILASYFFGGVFAGNAIPHIVAGLETLMSAMYSMSELLEQVHLFCAL
eukprot:gene27707-34470_t